MSKTYPRVIELLKQDIASGETLRGIVRKTGLNSNTVANYLEGMTEPTQGTLIKLAQAYNVSVAWLRGDSDDATAPQYPTADTICLASLTAEKRALWDAVNRLSPAEAAKVLGLFELLRSKD